MEQKSVTKVTKGETACEEEMIDFLDESVSELTEQQKKLPDAIKKAILKKKGGDSKDDKKSKDNKKEEKSDKKTEEKSDAKGKGLWHNIREKKKEKENYRPAKPGDKDYPDPKSLKKAQESSKKKKNLKK